MTARRVRFNAITLEFSYEYIYVIFIILEIPLDVIIGESWTSLLCKPSSFLRSKQCLSTFLGKLADYLPASSQHADVDISQANVMKHKYCAVCFFCCYFSYDVFDGILYSDFFDVKIWLDQVWRGEIDRFEKAQGMGGIILKISSKLQKNDLVSDSMFNMAVQIKSARPNDAQEKAMAPMFTGSLHPYDPARRSG